MSDLIKIGSYQLGNRPVELYLNPAASGGSGDFVPGKSKDRKLTNIVVGILDVPLWGAWGTLVHEVMEVSLADHRVTYRAVGVFQPSTEEREFFFNHRVFTRMCDEVGNYLHECKHDFDRAYTKAQRALRKKKKKTP